MPLSANDFMFPSGDFRPEWLNMAGDTELSEAVEAMIDRAETLSATLDPINYDEDAVTLAETHLVNYFYWNSVSNMILFQPATQTREYESDRFSDAQLRMIEARMLEAKRGIPAELLPQVTGSSGYFQAVY